ERAGRSVQVPAELGESGRLSRNRELDRLVRAAVCRNRVHGVAIEPKAARGVLGRRQGGLSVAWARRERDGAARGVHELDRVPEDRPCSDSPGQPKARAQRAGCTRLRTRLREALGQSEASHLQVAVLDQGEPSASDNSPVREAEGEVSVAGRVRAKTGAAAVTRAEVEEDMAAGG